MTFIAALGDAIDETPFEDVTGVSEGGSSDQQVISWSRVGGAGVGHRMTSATQAIESNVV